MAGLNDIDKEVWKGPISPFRKALEDTISELSSSYVGGGLTTPANAAPTAPSKATGGIGDWVARKFSGEEGPGLGEVLGIPGSKPTATAPPVVAPGIVTPSPAEDRKQIPPLGLVPPAVIPDTTGNVPTATAQSLLQPGEKISGQRGVTPIGEVPTAVRTTKPKGGNVLLEARGLGLPAVAGTPSNVREPYTAPVDESKTAFGLIEKSIRDIQASPGGERTKNRQIAALRTKQAGLVGELEGHKITAASADKGHLAAAEARFDYQKANLEERQANRLAREAENTLRRESLSADKAAALKRQELMDWDKRRTVLGKTATGEHDEEKSLFEAIHIGEPIPEEYRESAKRVYQPFLSVVAEYEKKTGKKLTPAQLDEQKKNYIKNRKPNWGM